MVGQCGGSPEKRRKMESMCGLHRSQRGMPERQLPSTPDRLDCLHVDWVWDVVVPGCLLRISSNTHAFAKRRKNSIQHPTRAVLLQCDVVKLKECRGNVSEASDQDV